eukprot:COSAG03_NODE_7495_length_909_cov_4.425926_1_plen_211_part_10
MDPLSGSPLAVLDAGGSLSLVLDRVDENDALSAALTCTTFRDALFAQPRHAVREVGKQHEGKRIVTSVAGVASSAGRLAWVRRLGEAAPSWVRAWNWSTTLRLASLGALEALQWARANGCDWNRYTCTRAAAGGHLEVLQWARANGCDWNAGTCTRAAAGGHLEVLQWARANGCDWNAGTCSEAALHGHLNVLQWARANGCCWDRHTCSAA